MTSAIYDDAKSIIVDLLTDEVAQNIVPNLACYTGRAEWIPPTPDAKPPAWVIKLDDKYFGIDALFYFPQTLQRIYTRQYAALKTVAIREAAVLAGYQLKKTLADAPDSTSNKLGSVAPTTATKNYKALKDEARTSCVTQVKNKFAGGDFAIPSPDPLESACAAPASNKDRLTCELAFALGAALTTDTAAAQDHLLKAVAAIISDALRVAGAVPVQNQEKLYERTVLFVRDLVAKDADLAAIIAAYVKDVAALGPAALATAIANLKAGFERVQTQWKLNTSDNGVSLAAFIDTMASASGSLAELCPKDSTAPTCQYLARLQNGDLKTKLAWPILRAAAHRNIGDAVNVAIRAIFDSKEPKDCSTEIYLEDACKRDSFRTFLISFVQYLVETVSDGSPLEVTRAALRSSAVQAIRSLGVGGGFDRPGWRRWWVIATPGWQIFYPDLGLRASWNPGYVNRGNSGVRYVATASLLTFKPLFRYTETTYLAARISLLDPLAPLSEMAVRRTDDVTYTRESVLWWNAITPRVEIVYGIPSLSKHLVVGAGASLRWVIPEQISTMPVVYAYRGISGDSADRFFKHLEFGFVVKYIM